MQNQQPTAPTVDVALPGDELPPALTVHGKPAPKGSLKEKPPHKGPRRRATDGNVGRA